jgi:uncharacterized protein YndB with AHSA1/START domain
MMPALNLEVRRVIRATPERLFAAWTQPELLRRWWGPGQVTCPIAEVDLRVGGSYRLANQLPDGTVIWISGEFEVVAPPHELVYTWRVEPGLKGPQRVTVRFEPHDVDTELIVLHEQLPDVDTRDGHLEGWHGCLDKLAELLASG